MSPFASALQTAIIALEARYPKHQVFFFPSIRSLFGEIAELSFVVILSDSAPRAHTQAVGKIPIYARETCSHSAMARAQAVVAERRFAFADVPFEPLTGAEEDGADSASMRARSGRFLRFLETRPGTHVAVVAHTDFIRETLACAIGLGADHAVQDATTTHSEIWLVKDPRSGS